MAPPMKTNRFPFFGGSRLMSKVALDDREKRQYESTGRDETRPKPENRQ
jgi:hypothetical protein